MPHPWHLVVCVLVSAACRFDPAGIDHTAGAGPDASQLDSSFFPDEPVLGTGRDGAVVVTDLATQLNVSAALVDDLAAGSTAVSVASAEGFGPGDLVMLHHAAGFSGADARSGDQTTLDLTGRAIGEYQIVRLGGVAGSTLELARPAIARFPAVGSQVIRIAELTTLTVAPGGSVVAAPWDGRAGGVIAILATGVVTLDGELDGDRAGFRGGAATSGPSAYGCAALDGPSATGGGARKGEGLVVAGEPHGRGNLGHAAGGGNCHNGGGGGGGGAGQGGDGGGTLSANEPYGGAGGAALAFDPTERLVFGGGGGAGEDNTDNSNGRGRGGRGGGIVLVRGQALAGASRITASGGAGEAAPADGAGGGGGGGTVVVTAIDTVALREIRVRGGRGGASDRAGSGGGGGGGLVAVRAGGLSTPIAAQAGAGAKQGNEGADGSPGKLVL